jgi:hypothetical protein
VYLKTAVASPTTSAFVPGSGRDQQETTATVARLLNQLEAGGEVECLRMARQFDGSPALDCDTVEVTTEQIKRAIASLPQSQIDDIDFQHARVRDGTENSFVAYLLFLGSAPHRRTVRSCSLTARSITAFLLSRSPSLSLVLLLLNRARPCR